MRLPQAGFSEGAALGLVKTCVHPYSRGPLPGSPYKFLYIFENRVVGLEEVAGRTGRTGGKGGYLLLVHARGF